MAEKFTPGPWSIEWPGAYDELDGKAYITGQDGKALVCEILQPLTDEEGPYRGEADARLIAAAPDLYEACKRMRAIMYSPDSEESKLADAALAKADGVQS